jgi:PAS domain S-box-containing protein
MVDVLDASAPELQALRDENARLRHELQTLRDSLDEPQEIIRAIRGGEVDAVMVAEGDHESLYPLRRAETIYRDLIEDLIPFGVLLADSGGHCRYLSPSFLELVGMRLEEAQGTGWMGSLRVDERETTRADWFDAIRCGRHWNGEHTFVGRHGESRTILCRVVPVHNHENRISCWAGLLVDITERKQAEEVLHESSRRKDEFLAVLAHELRNPLAPVSNAVELLKLCADDPERIRQLQASMERQVRQLTRLIEDLLDVSRISRGQIDLRTRTVELGSVVRSAVEACRAALDQAGHRLTLEPSAESLWLEADPARLEQILQNLLNNAIRYTESGGHIGLATSREGREAVIRVRDNGIGIPAERLAQIFEMFVQVDPLRERSRSGLGIGLTLTKRLVDLHHGRIEARSAGSGHGSEFVVRLPLAAPPAGRAAAPAEPPARAARPRRVVVLDDSRAGADMFAMLVRSLGHEVDCVYDSQQAAEAIRTHRPDVVFSDISMPALDGYELARQLRAQPEFDDVVLVAMTGYGQPQDRERALAAGFDDHLVKPAETRRVQELLANPGRRRDAD